MRVEIKTEGGIAHFPGLSRPSAIDSESLGEDQARELERLVSASGFFDLPDSIGGRSGAADYQQHAITIDQGGRRKTVRLIEPFEGQELHELVSFVRGLVRSARQSTGG
jgi:hypothetical protein